LTDNTKAIDDRMITMDSTAINGNSGMVGVGEGDEEEDGEEEDVDEDVGVVDGEDEDELEVASTVPLMSA
jgi:hypothetical protein